MAKNKKVPLKIVVDEGHGRYTPGKRCMKLLDIFETREWILNHRIGKKLRKRLKKYNCEVLLVSDNTGNIDVSLPERCRRANEWGADVYISLHRNAGVNGGPGGGISVFYYSFYNERKEQAEALYQKLIEHQPDLIGNRCNPVVNKGFYVLANTKMPAFLIEHGFMDSSTDVPIILKPKTNTNAAIAIIEFLAQEFGLEKKSLPFKQFNQFKKSRV